MVITFEEEYLHTLYNFGKTSDKHHRYQMNVIRGYQKAVHYLQMADRIEDLFPFRSLHVEKLSGDKDGVYSVRANDQYRVEFTITQTDNEPIITICNILALSNHYKA